VTGAYPVLHVGSFGSAGPAQPAPPWTRTFRGIPASVSQARRFVAELLSGCPAREVLTACVSELCANAITHTASGQGGAFTVEVDLPRAGVARIAVTDDGGGPSLPVARPLDPLAVDPLIADPAALDPAAPDPAALDLMAEGGRGLALVAACTSRWGYAEDGPGLTVWAESCWPVAVSAPGRQPPARFSRRPRAARPGFSRPFPPSPDGDWPAGPAA
jgi:anti-sigma regulatory factor (Ser/Thr protein kinase)